MLFDGHENSHHVAKGRYLVFSTHWMEPISAVDNGLRLVVGSVAFAAAIFWFYSMPMLVFMSLGSGWSLLLFADGGGSSRDAWFVVLGCSFVDCKVFLKEELIFGFHEGDDG